MCVSIFFFQNICFFWFFCVFFIATVSNVDFMLPVVLLPMHTIMFESQPALFLHHIHSGNWAKHVIRIMVFPHVFRLPQLFLATVVVSNYEPIKLNENGKCWSFWKIEEFFIQRIFLAKVFGLLVDLERNKNSIYELIEGKWPDSKSFELKSQSGHAYQSA